MTRRTTIALAIANAALLAFILIYEQGTLSTGDVAGRSGQVLRSFVRDRVERVELVRGDDPAIVFVRERAEGEDSEVELGTWTLAEPIATAADDDAVDALLSALEWLSAHRTLEGVTAADRTRFGLDEPRFIVRFTVLSQVVELRVGNEAPTGEGIYASVEGEGRAYVVGADLLEALDHEASDFRSRTVFEGFYPTGVERVEVDGTTFEREDGVWLVREPGHGWANQGLVDRLTRLTRELEASRFISEEAGDLSEYGLDEPWHELVVTRGEAITDHRVARLRVGSACADHDGERYAIAADAGPVICVRESDLEALTIDGDRTREARLLPVADASIETVVITRGDLRVELRHEDDRWKLRTGPEGGASARADADDGAVGAWLAALRDERANAYEDFVEGVHGTDAPTARVRIERRGEEPALELVFGASDDEGIWVRRGDEDALVHFGPGVRPELEVDGLRFRSRQVFEADAAEASRVSATVGAVENRAVRGEAGHWALEAPIEADADSVVVRETTRQLSNLRAERFVAEEAAREHGLAAPFATVHATFTPAEGAARELTLRLGAETVGGRFAQVEGADVVFVLSTDRVAALTRPLVSLDLLTIDPDGLESLRLERGEEAFDLRREGTAWQLADGGTPHEARTQALMDRLGTLRAVGVVAYNDDLGPVALRVIATRRATVEGDHTVTLEVGEATGEGDDAYVPVRRAGLQVIYRVRPDTLRSLSDFHP
ncbi:MAG: DUF4340 domain-containing protein [Sandaracinaceae bacterium]|nr:DUF4340 domain-containing protein [Sandaracinaceae bacterium]